MLSPDERQALKYAGIYRMRGFNPIPSAMPRPGDQRKKPMYRFKEEYGWETPFPDSWFTEEAWEKHPTTNLQVLTGRMPWRLLVIDLDGEEARYVFRQWGKCPETWTVHRDGGASWHLWFRLPEGYRRPLPKGFLWAPDDPDAKHEAIERLCDCSLIVAPPSFHVKHRDSQYRFMSHKQSPFGMPLPAECPGWLLGRRPIRQKVVVPDLVPTRPRPTTRAASPDRLLDRNEILDRIHDKVGLARDWGVRFTGVVRGDWAECHSIERPDAVPSAAMNIRTGVYTDRGAKHRPLPLFDLMVATNNAVDFPDACARLMEQIR